MASNKVSYELSPENILARMNAGTRYTAYQLAAKFKVPTDDIRPKVLDLITKGSLVLARTARNHYYIKPAEGGQVETAENDEPVVIADGAFEIATPFVGVNLTGEMVGYDASLNTRAALCMTLRRIA